MELSLTEIRARRTWTVRPERGTERLCPVLGRRERLTVDLT